MEEGRKCCDCGIVKPLSDYYKCKRCRCKLCEAARVRKHRAANVERFRDYDKQRRSKELLTPEEWEAHIRKRYDYTVKYRETNPKKLRTHQAVARAVGKGTLIPKPCEICGEVENVHAHHDDYAKPLVVRWLCSEHHIAWHLENGEGANAH